MLVKLLLLLNLYHCVLACVSQYNEIEANFLSNETNVEKLQDVFFPVNGKGTIFAIVDYAYYDSNDTLVECPPSHGLDNKWYRFNYNIRENCVRSEQDVSLFCHWSWTDSAVYLLYGPRDIQVLAYTVNVIFPQVNQNVASTVTLQVENICSNVTYQHLLKLTSRLKALATGKNDSFTQPDLKGYATKEIFTYISNTQRPSSFAKHDSIAVFHQVIRYTIYTLNTVGAIFFAPILVSTAKRVYPYVYSGIRISPLYYAVTWALVITSVMISIIIVLFNLMIVILPSCEVSISLNLLYLILMPVVELISTYFVPIDTSLKIPKCIWFCTFGCLCNIAPAIIQRCAIWWIFVTLQLLNFHAVFLLIALFYWPLLTAGVIMANALIVFCTVSFIGILILAEVLLRRRHAGYDMIDVWMALASLVKAVIVGGVLYCLITTLIGFALESSTLNRIMVFVLGPLVATAIIAIVHQISRVYHHR